MTATDTGPQTEAQKVVRSWLRLWVPADQHADALRDLDIALAEARRLTVERLARATEAVIGDDGTIAEQLVRYMRLTEQEEQQP